MPLPPPTVARDEIHLRRVELRAWRRVDGLYDVEARMVDTKTESLRVGSGASSRIVPPGEAIHDMSVRLVLNERLEVQDVFACTDAAPQPNCPQAPIKLKSLIGLRIGAGWGKAVAERLAGHKGCTHLTELLKPLATVSMQMMWKKVENAPPALDAKGKPRKIDTCFAYASDGDLVRQEWPLYFTGVAGLDQK